MSRAGVGEGDLRRRIWGWEGGIVGVVGVRW